MAAVRGDAASSSALLGKEFSAAARSHAEISFSVFVTGFTGNSSVEDPSFVIR